MKAGSTLCPVCLSHDRSWHVCYVEVKLYFCNCGSASLLWSTHTQKRGCVIVTHSELLHLNTRLRFVYLSISILVCLLFPLHNIVIWKKLLKYNIVLKIKSVQSNLIGIEHLTKSRISLGSVSSGIFFLICDGTSPPSTGLWCEGADTQQCCISTSS